MKSVAIVGFYDLTLPQLKESQAGEVWLANHGMMIMGGKQVERCTRLFELHKRDWFTRKELPSHKQYWEYLTQPHEYPIYLQTPVAEIPNSVIYPFDGVCADLFPHLLRRYKDGREVADKFLTSSASLMLALAIYEGYERIEVYGIGMETETEYAYQLPGFTYMIGLANGRGIDVVQMEDSPICKAEVYAYTAIPYVTLGRLRELAPVYASAEAEARKVGLEAVARHNKGETTDMGLTQKAADLASAHTGASAALKMLIEQDSQYMSRQAFEIQRRRFYVDCENFKAETNALSGQFAELVQRKKNDQARAVWAKYLNARASMHANSGAVQLLDHLMKECDLLKPDHNIVLTIEDA